MKSLDQRVFEFCEELDGYGVMDAIADGEIVEGEYPPAGDAIILLHEVIADGNEPYASTAQSLLDEIQQRSINEREEKMRTLEQMWAEGMANGHAWTEEDWRRERQHLEDRVSWE